MEIHTPRATAGGRRPSMGLAALFILFVALMTGLVTGLVASWMNGSTGLMPDTDAAVFSTMGAAGLLAAVCLHSTRTASVALASCLVGALYLAGAAPSMLWFVGGAFFVSSWIPHRGAFLELLGHPFSGMAAAGSVLGLHFAAFGTGPSPLTMAALVPFAVAAATTEMTSHPERNLAAWSTAVLAEVAAGVALGSVFVSTGATSWSPRAAGATVLVAALVVCGLTWYHFSRLPAVLGAFDPIEVRGGGLLGLTWVLVLAVVTSEAVSGAAASSAVVAVQSGIVTATLYVATGTLVAAGLLGLALYITDRWAPVTGSNYRFALADTVVLVPLLCVAVVALSTSADIRRHLSTAFGYGLEGLAIAETQAKTWGAHLDEASFGSFAAFGNRGIFQTGLHLAWDLPTYSASWRPSEGFASTVLGVSSSSISGGASSATSSKHVAIGALEAWALGSAAVTLALLWWRVAALRHPLLSVLFADVVWQGSRAGDSLALTFNGMSASVGPRLLDALKSLEARATFFVTPAQARAHADLLARAVDEGHELGVLGTLAGSESPAAARDEMVRGRYFLGAAADDFIHDVTPTPTPTPSSASGLLSPTAQVHRGEPVSTTHDSQLLHDEDMARKTALRDAPSTIQWFRPHDGGRDARILREATALGLQVALWSALPWGPDDDDAPGCVAERMSREMVPRGAVVAINVTAPDHLCHVPGDHAPALAASAGGGTAMREWRSPDEIIAVVNEVVAQTNATIGLQIVPLSELVGGKHIEV